MSQPRSPLTYLFLGAALGAILGAVVGVAIGSSAGRSAAAPARVRTVVSTETVHGPLLPLGVSTTDTTTTDAPTTDTTPATTDTTPQTTDTATTDTTATGQDANNVPPVDPYNLPPDFCTAHVCAPGFSHGFGAAVQCADGIWTRQTGSPGTCRSDGGVRK